MSDIVNRLRHIGVTLADLKSLRSKRDLAEISADAYKAADEITRLRAEVERLNKNDLLAQDAIHEADKRAEAAEARVAVLVEALEDLKKAFLLRHGCWPLDETNEDQRFWCAAMRKALAVLKEYKR